MECSCLHKHFHDDSTMVANKLRRSCAFHGTRLEETLKIRDGQRTVTAFKNRYAVHLHPQVSLKVHLPGSSNVGPPRPERRRLHKIWHTSLRFIGFHGFSICNQQGHLVPLRPLRRFEQPLDR